jgi:hypothetical protein
MERIVKSIERLSKLVELVISKGNLVARIIYL